MNLADILKTTNLMLGIAKYLGLIEDHLSITLDKLTKVDFDSGIRALEDAADSNSEQTSLLRVARDRFYSAISFEKGLRLAYTYLGLALCHTYLGDPNNAQKALNKLLKVELPELNQVVSFVGVNTTNTVLEKPWLIAALGIVPMGVPLIAATATCAGLEKEYRKAEDHLKQLKAEAKFYI